MRIVIVVEAWPGEGGVDLPASAAAVLVAEAWEAGAPGHEVITLAVGDGGTRTADALAGERMRLHRADAVATGEALVLAPPDGAATWNPRDLASALTRLAHPSGEDEQPERRTVVIPLGDEDPDGEPLDLWGCDMEGPDLAAARAALAPLAILALVTSTRPLLGFKGMAAASLAHRAPDDAGAEAAQERERRWAEVAREADVEVAAGAPPTLIASTRLSAAPGSGAAGGLAYALAAVGARLTPGAAYAASIGGLDAAAETADLVVAVTRSLTPHGIDHGIVAPASAAAARRGVPCVVIAPVVGAGKRDQMAAGLTGVYECAPGAATLADRIRRVARTWTP